MHFALHADPLDALETPLLAVPMYSDDGAPGAAFEAADAAVGGLLGRLVGEERFKAEPGDSLLVHVGQSIARALVVGLGASSDATPADLRSLTAAAVQEANKRNLVGVAALLPEGDDADKAVRFAVEGAILGGYRYDEFLTRDVDPLTCDEVSLALGGIEASDFEAVVKRAEACCAGVCLARDLVNGPPNEVTPLTLAAAAQAIADESGLEIEVFDKAEIERRGMRLLMAVNAGSEIEPRFIHLTYRPEGATESTPSIALVGKGLTFDAGGYNIKPTGSIEEMKLDMGGGATVLGLMKAVAALAPNYIVHGIVPSTENLVSGLAYKPGDIYRSLNGKTVEIMNTDAEGRLILADALCYAERLGVDRIVDFATLTGACVVALGPHTAGVWSTDESFQSRYVDAAKRAGELAWPMPLEKKLKSMLKSPVADMKNVGERWGGAITAALFLSEFVGDVTWVHVDLAGPSFVDKSDGHISKGGTGYGVLTLAELLSGEL